MFTRDTCVINGLLHLIVGIFSIKSLCNAIFVDDNEFNFYYDNFLIENLAIAAYLFDILVSFSNLKILSRCRNVTDVYFHHVPILIIFLLTIPTRNGTDPICNSNNIFIFRFMQSSAALALLSGFNESIMAFQYSKCAPDFFCSSFIMSIEYIIKIVYFSICAIFSNIFYLVAIILASIEGNFSIFNFARLLIFFTFAIYQYPKLFSNAIERFTEGPRIPYDCD